MLPALVFWRLGLVSETRDTRDFRDNAYCGSSSSISDREIVIAGRIAE